MNTNHKHVEELETTISNGSTIVNDVINTKTLSYIFNENKVIHDLHHYLPSQNPLKDFVHHNSLHSFQEFPFHEAIARANEIMGYKGYLQLDEYKTLYREKKITNQAINYAIKSNVKDGDENYWKSKLFANGFDENTHQRIGNLREQWKSKMHINLDKEVFPILLRLISNYLDQGISIWHFPIVDKSFLDAIKHIEKNTKESLFRTKKAKGLLFENDLSITKLLKLIVGKEECFEHYLFDQQFSHPGWSGMVAVLESNPKLLFDKRKITLNDFIIVELLLEIDVLYDKYDDLWSPLGYKANLASYNLFEKVEDKELFTVYKIWQEAYEWTYYENVLSGLSYSSKNPIITSNNTSFQAFFCIDDREISLRQHLELVDEKCETFGTPGHYNIVAYYQPDKGKFLTKVCPAPLQPKHVLKEIHKDKTIKSDLHFSRKTHSMFWGFIYSQTLGFLSGLNLFKIMVSPNYSAGTNYSFDHMHKDASLQIEYNPKKQKSKEYQEGFTVEEMTDIVESILRTTGLTENFAKLIYFIGHGASSTNNPYYAGYGCGACSGRPGSANARAAAEMVNRADVRSSLEKRGIKIPTETWFVGGLHDTTRDEVAFYDEELIADNLNNAHQENLTKFQQALINNAKERARRFDNISLNLNKNKNYELVKKRSLKLFEIRPEYNHATNTLFIVGRRSLTKNLFLDRRAFLNSYDYNQDPKGDLLATILGAGAGVCAGINLEYYFSRVDNHRLGAGSKLPQNIVGLIGVANGVEGDLRTGLPYQMVEIHDPLRLMTIIEQKPEVVLNVLNNNQNVKQWYANGWMNLAVLDPSIGKFFIYKNNEFVQLQMELNSIGSIANIEQICLTSRENLPVSFINKN
jgi:hypothetical protein